MIAANKHHATGSVRTLRFDEPSEEPQPYGFSVALRGRPHVPLEGIEAHKDGISFCSPEPMAGGKPIELVICQSILVDATVVGCTVMPGGPSGYWVRARYYNVSHPMQELLEDEVKRAMTLAD